MTSHLVGGDVATEWRPDPDVRTVRSRSTIPVGCSSSAGLMNAVEGSNLYRDVAFLGGDGTEPHDAVFAPDYAYDLESATDAWARVILRAGAGGPWALPLALQ